MGDITDWVKFSLLRELVGEDKNLGVAWYYVPELKVEDQALLDREISAALTSLPRRTVRDLQQLPIWRKGTQFFIDPMPTRARRTIWFESMKRSLVSADIVFLDPDNGLGQADAEHATVDEVKAFVEDGKAVVLIHFPHHGDSHENQVLRHHIGLNDSQKLSIFTVVTSVTSYQERSYGVRQYTNKKRWFTVINADEELLGRAQNFVKRMNLLERCSAQICR